MQYDICFTRKPVIPNTDNRETKIEKVSNHYQRLYNQLSVTTNLFGMKEVLIQPVIATFTVEGTPEQAEKLRNYLLKQGDRLIEVDLNQELKRSMF